MAEGKEEDERRDATPGRYNVLKRRSKFIVPLSAFRYRSL